MSDRPYNNTDNPKTVNKTLSETPTHTATITPYQPLSELTGTIILAYNSALDSANYCSFGSKYYFITDRILLTGGKIQLTLRVDVLMTYKTAIKNCPAILARTETKEAQDIYIADPDYPIEQYKKIVIKNFAPFSYSQNQFIACITG